MLCSVMREKKDLRNQMFGLARLLWLNCLNKRESYADEDWEMSSEINKAHSSEVTLQKLLGRRETARESTAMLIYFCYLLKFQMISFRSNKLKSSEIILLSKK